MVTGPTFVIAKLENKSCCFGKLKVDLLRGTVMIVNSERTLIDLVLIMKPDRFHRFNLILILNLTRKPASELTG